MRNLSIKLKITLWFTLFMTVMAGVAISVLLYIGERQAYQEAEHSLAQIVEMRTEPVQWKEGKMWLGEEEPTIRGAVYLSIYNQDGQLIWGQVPEGFNPDGTFTNREMAKTGHGDEGWVYYDAKHQIKGHEFVWVRGVMSAGYVNSAYQSMIKVAIPVLPLFILFAAVGGYLIIHRALGPIRKITKLAGDMGDGKDLDRRIGMKKGRDEVFQLAEAFDKMLERLESAFENEKRFTADASHELRTPVTIIMSQCELALSDATSEEEYHDALEVILDQSEKMSSMISQLLTLARADKSHQSLHMEEVNISELTEVIVQQQQELAEKHNIVISKSIEEGLSIKGDETMILRLWINLIDNAIKHGGEDGHIQVTLKKANGGVIGLVMDQGPGISKEDQAHVFSRFWQGSKSRVKEGTGLGLSMVQWIVKAHGGSINLESQLGKGTTFEFFLPDDPATEK